MKTVTVELKNEDAMFLLPSVNVSLNFENVGPCSVDVDSLSDLDYHALRFAAHAGTVACSEPLGVRGQPVPAKEPEPAPPVTTPAKLRVTPTKEARVRQQELIAILNGNARAVKLAVKEMDDLRDIRFLLESERRGKKRKGVIALLQKAIEEFNDAVASSINSNEGIMLEEEQAGIGGAFEVEEGDEAKEVTIQLAKLD